MLKDAADLQDANAKLQEEITRLKARQQELVDRVGDYQRERFQVWVAANGAETAGSPHELVARPVAPIFRKCSSQKTHVGPAHQS